MENEKAIRAAKLTLGGLLEKRRAGEAKDRAPGQIAPSKYLPGVPRAVHANGGRVYPLDERSGWYGDANYQQTGGKMVMMSPDEYLSKVRPLDIDEGSRDNIEDLKNHILSGRKLDPLKIDAKGREDGRHRAHAARELGIKSVPVLTWPGDNIAKANGGPVTDNDNFQSWFGNSVTHTDGQPHVFYTGTSKDKDFTSFNVGRHGAWFTRDPEVASQYADANDSQGYKQDGWNMVKTNTASRVIPAYVKAENPYTGELPQEYMRDNYKAAQSDWFDKLRRMGHDAWMPSSQGGNLVVALKEPQQIKSIYNKGTFDPGQKHMNKADGGAAGSDMFQGIHPTVQDEQGAPMDLYHGTPGEPFSAFDDKKPGERDAGFFGKGHYLTPIKGNAEGYADPDEMGKGSVMGPLHAALKNPYVWDTSSDAAAHRTLRDLQSMGIMRDKQELNSWDNLQRHHMDTFMGEMKKRGHDGVVVRTKSYDERPHNTTEIVVFKPSNIKHKDAEVFDPNDPNIYRAAGGVAK